MKYKKIATHFRPDLDACLAVWAARMIYGDLPVDFVSKNLTVLNPDTLYVDITCGIKEQDGKCAGAYLVSQLKPAQAKAMLWIADYVNGVDTGIIKSNDHGAVIGLSATINALKYVLTDIEIIRMTGLIFDGFLEMSLSKQKAKDLANHAVWIGDVAIITQIEGETICYGVQNYLPREPCAIITVIGKNIGAKRIRDNIDLTKLDLPDGWFKHPSGFMVQWGDLSGKGTPASKRTELSVCELAEKILAL